MYSYSKLHLVTRSHAVAARAVVCSRGLKTRRCDRSSGERVNTM